MRLTDPTQIASPDPVDPVSDISRDSPTKRILRSVQIEKIDGINENADADLADEERALAKKLSPAFVKNLLSNESMRLSVFKGMSDSNFSVKRFAKVLKLRRPKKIRKLDAKERREVKFLQESNLLFHQYGKYLKANSAV
ncbi:unnamed protein product [Phytophthora lilii]|uniref:RxLR effector protein n=1 Tax=Phytophthora lilii TaxID=2077276 RepID=A0A9W6TP29_9STRA|nr:unnamed protein product [Phytophthora lilii]